jgi:prepilin-type processing-associated H-X9-DG protein
VVIPVTAMSCGACCPLLFVAASLVRGSFGLALGVLGLVAGLAAILSGLIAFRRGRGWDAGGGGPARLGLWIAILAIATAGMVAILSPVAVVWRHPDRSPRDRCAANLFALGRSLRNYAHENDGQFPASLVELFRHDPLVDPNWLVCPATTDTAPRRTSSPPDISADIRAGGHLSYWYVGRGLRLQDSADSILAVEPLENHGNQGINVLYLDGRVEFRAVPEAEPILNQLRAGVSKPN